MRRVIVLVLSGLLLGAVLTGAVAALPGSQGVNAMTWLSTVSTVAALVVAVGIYRVQQTQSDLAHQELLDALKAQDQILQDLGETSTPSEPETPPREDDLTDAQRRAVEAQFGDQAIEAAWRFREGRGKGPRLIRLDDGTLVTVFSPREGGDPRVRRVARRDGSRPRARRQRADGEQP